MSDMLPLSQESGSKEGKLNTIPEEWHQATRS